MKKITKLVLALVLCVVGAGVNSVYAEIVTTKTPVILTGGKFADCFVPGTYVIQMQGWQSFVAYEDEEGVAFDETSTMVFNLDEAVTNGGVRVTFTFSDGTSTSTRQEWWCLGIGSSPDDTNNAWGHDFDGSTYYLKKAFGADWVSENKSSLKITKVTVDNFGTDDTFTYKVQGGTICGQPMTIKNANAKVFGAYGGEFRATAGFTNVFQFKPFNVGDYQKLVVKFAEPVPSTGNWKINHNSGYFSLNGLTEYEIALDGTNINDFTIFNWDANPDPIEIDEVYFYKEVNNIEAVELFKAPAGTTDLNGMTGTGAIKWDVTYPQKIGPGIGWLGDIDTDNNSVNILTYDYLHFVVSNVEDGKKLSLRVFVSDEERSDNEKRHCLYPRPIAEVADVSDWETVYYISSPGTYVVKISDYPLLRGFKGGNGYWGDESNGTITVSQAYVSSGAPVAYVPTNGYVLAGASTGSASLAAALADASAIYYDATGVIATGVELTPANPNALFTANEGALSNANNVIVNGTCANLVLTDGHPFKAPADFTATSATYTTTINTAAKAGTLILPFAATIPEGVKAYTLTYASGDAVTATEQTGTIPASVPVLLNGSGEVTFTGSGTVTNVPTANIASNLVGVYEETTVPLGSYVLQNGDDGVGFYKVTTDDIKANPFRAYLTAQGPAAKVRVIYEADDATAITSLEAQDVINETIYNLNGMRVSHPTKGIYIKNGKKFIVK